jgi:hypothetical protein
VPVVVVPDDSSVPSDSPYSSLFTVATTKKQASTQIEKVPPHGESPAASATELQPEAAQPRLSLSSEIHRGVNIQCNLAARRFHRNHLNRRLIDGSFVPRTI